jgi:hypothetical protein
MKHLVLFIFIFLAGSAALHAQSITSDKTGENGIRKIEVTGRRGLFNQDRDRAQRR